MVHPAGEGVSGCDGRRLNCRTLSVPALQLHDDVDLTGVADIGDPVDGVLGPKVDVADLIGIDPAGAVGKIGVAYHGGPPMGMRCLAGAPICAVETKMLWLRP